MKDNYKIQKGAALIIVLVFTSIFIIVSAGLLQLVGTLYKTAIKKQNLEKAFQIAEAGVNYYKWRLSHTPGDYTGAGDYDYYDPYGGKIGHYNLQIIEPLLGSTVVTVISTGYLDDDPNISRIIETKFGMKSLSDFTFLTNSNIWFGEKEEIVGKVHSNGGIRMDGECDSIMQSARETYICGPEHGCDYENKPGIWGDGEIEELWQFPPDYQVSTVDFNEISLDLGGEGGLKEKANEPEGVYLDYSGTFGYHIKFKKDPVPSFDVYQVTNVIPTYGWDFTDGWEWRYIDINAESYLATYNMPANGIIFVEDQTWVDGEIFGRVTLAAANFLETGSDRSIIIHDDIIYEEKDGNHSIGLIAQKDVLLPLYGPERLEINAAMIAQKGHAFIYYYSPAHYGSDLVVKDQIEVFGSVATNTVWTWSWVASEEGPVVSGYDKTETTYDTNLYYAPPPDFPHDEEYEMISWREIF